MTLSDQLNQVSPLALQQAIRASLAASHIDPSALPAVDLNVIPPGTDLSKFMPPDGTKWTTVAGAHYACAGTWYPQCSSVTIDGTGSFLDGTLSPGAGSLIDAKGTRNFTFAGFQISAPVGAIIFRGGPSSVFASNTILGTVETVCQFDYPQANGSACISNVQRAPSGSRFCYVNGADACQIIGNTIAGSVGEDAIRATPDGVSGHVPDGLKITRNKIAFASKLGKSSISLREATNATISNNDITGWVRLGENAGSITVPNVTVTGNMFHPDPNNHDQISCMAATARIEGNIFLLNATQRAISGSGASQLLSVDGNTKSAQPGVATKKLVNWSGQIGPNLPRGESDGTNTKPIVQ